MWSISRTPAGTCCRDEHIEVAAGVFSPPATSRDRGLRDGWQPQQRLNNLLGGGLGLGDRESPARMLDLLKTFEDRLLGLLSEAFEFGDEAVRCADRT